MRKSFLKTKLFIITIIGSSSLIALADDDGKLFERWNNSNQPGVSSVKFQQYNDICGQCHFPYQPGLLPAIAWEKIITHLDDHFGQPVEITEVDNRTMMRYVLDNSAGHVNDEISNKILQSLKYNPIPTRISQTPYWKYMHKDIDKNLINQSYFQCDECHQDAKQGQYKNHTLNHNSYNEKNRNTSELIM